MSDAELADALAAVERPDHFDVVLPAYGIDPLGKADAVVDRLGELTALGATVVTVRFFATSVDHWIEQAEALAQLTTLQ
jgi:hypothetical protein